MSYRNTPTHTTRNKQAAAVEADPSFRRAAGHAAALGVPMGMAGAGLMAPVGGAAGLLYGLLRKRKDGESRGRNALKGLITGTGAGALGGGLGAGGFGAAIGAHHGYRNRFPTMGERMGVDPGE